MSTTESKIAQFLDLQTFDEKDPIHVIKLMSKARALWTEWQDKLDTHERTVFKDLYMAMLDAISFLKHKILTRTIDFIDVYDLIIKPKI